MTEIVKRKVIRRLRILEGQVRGLQNMVEAGKYCVDVLRQTSAVKEAISGVEDQILENHLSTHVMEQIKSGKGAQAKKEIMEVYKLSKKK